MSNEPIDPDNLEVLMDQKGTRFHIRTEDAEDAYISYDLQDDGTLLLTKTFVPDALRDIGVATRIADELFRWVQENDRKVSIDCPFIEDYVDKRPFLAAYVVDEDRSEEE